MAKFKSFFENSGPNGTTRTPCFTCAHCNQIFAVPKPDDAQGFCLKCMHHVCLRCGGSERCVPFERKIEAIEAKARQRERLFGAL